MSGHITIRDASGNSRKVYVDIAAELDRFTWLRPRWTSDKLIAASPFRYDGTPSFMVRLEPHGDYPAGVWTDQGASDPEWASGGFTKLLAFLMDVTDEEAADYLLATYASEGDEDEAPIRLSPMRLTVPAPYKPLPTSLLDDYRYRHVYLGTRMISETIQRLARIGYDKRRQAVTFPWFNPDGTLGNVKYRKVGEKTFWFAKGGRRISDMLYGIDVIYRKGLCQAVIVEGEVDTLTFMSAGVPSIAVGGAAFSKAKRDLILRSPIEHIVIATDNDEAGRKLGNEIMRQLAGKVAISFAVIPEAYKDINEMAVKTRDLSAVKAVAEDAKPLRIPWALRLKT